MKIGIISDMHGNLEAWQAVMSGVFKDVDKVLIAGDIYGAGLVDRSASFYQPEKLKEQLAHSPIPLLCIRGNCDTRSSEPDELTGELFGKKFYMCHGQECTSDRAIAALAKQHQASILIYGHTHQWRLEKIGELIIINPGSPTLPDINNYLTVAILDQDKISILDISNGHTLATLENK